MGDNYPSDSTENGEMVMGEVMDQKLLSLDPITRRAVEQQGKAVWFDSKESFRKRRKRNKIKEGKKDSTAKQLSPNEEVYLKQRLQKAKKWLPKRVRKCERIKKHFKK